MDIQELNRILRNKAIKNGLCDDWQKNVWNTDLSYDELLDIYVRGLDFSVKKNWLDYDFIKEVFPQEKLHAHHIYIDETVDLDGDNGIYIFIGRCRGSIVFNGLLAATVYIFHHSEVSVTANDGARVQIRYYENGTGLTINDPYSKIRRINK